MDLGQLEAFLEVARHGRFHKAAEELYLTQPSLSARIQKLEIDLNVVLFHRTARGVRLTEPGRLLLPYAQRVLTAVSQARETLNAAEQLKGGSLRIGTARTVGAYVLPSILEEFHKNHPMVDVNIRTGRSSEVLQMVVNEEVAIGLARNLRHPDILTLPLYEEEVVLVTHPDHKYANNEHVSIFEIAREPLILYDRESSFFQLIDSVCREASIVPNVSMELDSVEATKRMIERGLGISLLPIHSISLEVNENRLAKVKIKHDQEVTVPTAILIRDSAPYSPAVLAFIDILRHIYNTNIKLNG